MALNPERLLSPGTCNLGYDWEGRWSGDVLQEILLHLDPLMLQIMITF